MIKRILVMIGLCVLCMTAAFAKTPTIQHWVTKQGTKVLFVQSKSLPMLDLDVVFAAGSAYDDKAWGLASLTNHLLGEGTATDTADQIADQFDSVGAEFNVAVNADMAVVSLRTLTKAKYYQKALASFVDVLAHPNFPEKSVVRIKSQMMASLKVDAQTPTHIATKTFYGLLYGDQPYAHSSGGTLNTIPKLTQSQIKQFYNRFYVAKNALIIMVGDLTKTQATQVADTISAALSVGAPAPKLPLAIMHNPGAQKHVAFPAAQTAILYGQLGITRHNPDYFPLTVGNYILGGLPMSSLLFDRVREQKGLAYYAVSGFSPLRYKGPFIVQLKTRADKTVEAIKTVEDTVTQFIQAGPTTNALTQAKRYITGSFPLSIATNKAIANVLVNIAFYNRPLNYLDTYLAKVNAVTKAAVKTAFQKTVMPKKMILVTVGPSTNEKR